MNLVLEPFKAIFPKDILPGKVKRKVTIMDYIKTHIAPVFCGLIFLGALFPINDSFAGEYDEELKRFDFDIEYKSIQQLNQEFHLTDFIKTLNLSGPIYPVKSTPKQVKLKIEDALQKEVNQKYNPSRYDEIKKESEEKYKMYKVGTKVSIQRQYGSQLIEVNGLLEAISNDMVKISGLPIPTVDIQRQDLARLYWTEHEHAVATQIRNKTRKFEDERAEYIESARKRISKKVWTENGYRKLKKSGRWVSVLELVLHKHQKAHGKKLNRLREVIRKQTYEDNNYIYVQDRNGWIPRRVLVAEAKAEEEENRTLLDKVKLFFRKKGDGKESPPTPPKTAKVVKKEDKEKTDLGSPESKELNDSEKEAFQEEDDLWEEDVEEEVGKGTIPDSELKRTEDKGNEKSNEENENDVSDLFDEDFE